jgi:signal transduction histidine kinase
MAFIMLYLDNSTILGIAALVMSIVVNIWLGYRLSKERRDLERTVRELEQTQQVLKQKRDLAFDTGQTLASLCVQLNVARKFKGRDPHRADDALDVARDLAGDSLSRVREIVKTA